MPLKPATRQRVKARLCFLGMTKTGKSYTALSTLRGIVGPAGRIAAIDTENGNLSLYAGQFPGDSQPTGFDVEVINNFSPDAYKRVHDEAVKAKYDGFLIDSTSQEWEGKGGILEIVDGVTDKFFTGWKNATPKHNEFMNMIVNSPMHMVVTVRQKDTYIITEGNAPKLVGTEPVQRKRFEYEFNAVFEMDHDHNLRVQYSLIPFLPNGTFISRPEGIVLGSQLRAWLDLGESDFTAPRYAKTFYLNGKEVVSGGIEKETYVEALNLGLALVKATKDRDIAKRLVAEFGKDKLADLDDEEGHGMIAKMKVLIADADK